MFPHRTLQTSSRRGSPSGRGHYRGTRPPLRITTAALAALLLTLGACGPDPAVREPAVRESAARESAVRDPSPGVRPGIAVLLSDSLHLVSGRRAGLVTNHTGIWKLYPAGAPDTVRSTVDVVHEHPDVELVALYGPEHGLTGHIEAGVRVPSERHAATGLPIYSLYGESRRPLPEMLEGVEVLLFDMQDIGARYYTYVSTMALAMEAAGEAHIPFVVLDRPNPIDGVHVQGNVLDPDFATFVGLYPVPMRHGMTVGELARLYVDAFGIDVDLHVVPMEGWDRKMLFGETDLPWVAPSPNMPSVESALHYPGTCLFEGTNLSVARGTDRPFQQIGAPWLDAEALAERMNARRLPGVRFEPVVFVPDSPGDAKFDGVTVRGVRLVATDPDAYDPTRTAVALLVETRRMSGDRWRWHTSHFDRLAGTDRLRLGIDAGLGAEELTAGWDGEVAAFTELREPALIY